MVVKIALAGNPNCGKTTMFNELTGSAQYVGNWPGVTVEKKEGHLKGHKDVIIVDLPGVYSLSPYTLEEVVTRNFLLAATDGPDVILNIIDSTNLERNLYPVSYTHLDVYKRQGESQPLCRSYAGGCGSGFAGVCRVTDSIPVEYRNR